MLDLIPPGRLSAVFAFALFACDSSDGTSTDTTTPDGTDAAETDSLPGDSNDVAADTVDTAEPDTAEPDTAEPDTADSAPADTEPADTAEDTAADTTGDADAGLAKGVYASVDDPLRLFVPAGALPADWSPVIERHEGVDIDLSMIGLALRVGPIYSLDSAAPFDDRVFLELPYPEVADNEIFVALIHEPALDDWVFLPYAIDGAADKVYIEAPHFSDVTTVTLAVTSLAACQVLAPGLGAQCGAPTDSGAAPVTLEPLGTAPAVAMGSLYAATAQAQGLSAANAVAAQQSMNALGMAAVSNSVAMILSRDPDADVDQTLSDLQPNTLTSGSQAQAYLPASAAPSADDPCAGDPCAPGTCTPSGTYASCQCPPPTFVSGLRCATRNEPPALTVDRSPFMFVAPGEGIALAAAVVDPEGEAVTVTWLATDGVFEPAIGASTIYRAPSIPGVVTARVIASDPSGGERELRLTINVVPGPLHRWSFDVLAADAVPDLAGDADLELFGGASLADGRLELDGVDDYARSLSLAGTIGEKTLIARVALANTVQSSGGALTLELSPPDGADVFDAIVFGERQPEQWMAGSDSFSRTPEDNGGPPESSTALVTIAVVYAASGEIRLYRDGIIYATPATLGPLVTYGPGSDFIFGARHEDMLFTTGTAEGTDAYLAGTIDEALVYGRALTSAEIAWLEEGWATP